MLEMVKDLNGGCSSPLVCIDFVVMSRLRC